MIPPPPSLSFFFNLSIYLSNFFSCLVYQTREEVEEYSRTTSSLVATSTRSCLLLLTKTKLTTLLENWLENDWLTGGPPTVLLGLIVLKWNTVFLTFPSKIKITSSFSQHTHRETGRQTPTVCVLSSSRL